MINEDNSVSHRGICGDVLVLHCPLEMARLCLVSVMYEYFNVNQDPNEDGNLSFSEFLWFSYKNLGAILNTSSAFSLLVQVYVTQNRLQYYNSRCIHRLATLG